VTLPGLASVVLVEEPCDGDVQENDPDQSSLQGSSSCIHLASLALEYGFLLCPGPEEDTEVQIAVMTLTNLTMLSSSFAFFGGYHEKADDNAAGKQAPSS
jgi:hypothetical protein